MLIKAIGDYQEVQISSFVAKLEMKHVFSSGCCSSNIHYKTWGDTGPPYMVFFIIPELFYSSHMHVYMC